MGKEDLKIALQELRKLQNWMSLDYENSYDYSNTDVSNGMLSQYQRVDGYLETAIYRIQQMRDKNK
jgi:hypothetical protein